MNPIASLYNETGERILAPAGRLKALQTQELSMAARYAPDHPDLLRTRKEIAAIRHELGDADSGDAVRAKLSATRSEYAEAHKKYSDDHPDVKRLERTIAALEQGLTQVAPVSSVKPDNPAYIELRTQVEAANVDLRTLRDNQMKLKGKLEDYERHLALTPQVESKYRALMRDYDNAQRKYQEIRAKQMEAQLSQSLENERKGERFTMIEPPLLPEIPIKPNRTAILLLGMVFSLAGGAGTGVFAESLDTSVRGAKGVVDMLRIPPLGVVPYIGNAADRTRRVRRLRRWRMIGMGACGALIVLLALFHFFIKPLDVLWFIASRRLGI